MAYIVCKKNKSTLFIEPYDSHFKTEKLVALVYYSIGWLTSVHLSPPCNDQVYQDKNNPILLLTFIKNNMHF